MEKVSIIVPVYNNELYLEKCLDSIINQTYKNIEIILINDGSTDNSLNILRKYEKKDKRIIIIDKKNEGVSIARNAGIKKSTGEYITFVDSDDYIDLNFIEELHNAMINNNVDLVRCNYQVHYKELNKIDIGNLKEISNKKLNKKNIRNEILEKVLDGSLPCFVYLLMIKKEKLLNTKLFPTDIHMMEDVVLYMDLIMNINSMFIIDKPLYNIYYNELGATNNAKNYERNINNVLLVNIYIHKILSEYKYDTNINKTKLNTANSIAISDFIFRHYLAKYNALSLCKELSKNEIMNNILDNINYNEIEIQRKIILKCIKYKKFVLLNIYFKLRKIIYKIKR